MSRFADRNPPFLAEYRHDGRVYSVVVGGDTWEEAEAHLQSIAATGTIVGRHASEGPIDRSLLQAGGDPTGGRVQ